MIVITVPIIELGVGQEMVMEIEIEEIIDLRIDKFIEETILDRTIRSKGKEIEV